VQWGCDKKKVSTLADLWRWDLRKVHNAFLKEIEKKQNYFSFHPEVLSAKAQEYDNLLDEYIRVNECVPKAKRESPMTYKWRQCICYWKHFI
jgi:hypothetical protein